MGSMINALVLVVTGLCVVILGWGIIKEELKQKPKEFYEMWMGQNKRK